MSYDERSKFFEFKTFKDHIEMCDECQKKISSNEIYQEIMAHAEQMEDNEMLKEQMKHNEKLMEV